MDTNQATIGKFIVIEGLDGAGTTTQAKLLYTWFQELGKLVYLTREPSDGPIGLQIRMWLVHRFKVSEETLALMFAADRLDHIFDKPNHGRRLGGVQSFIEQGYNVISDRYYLSSLAYQALACDIGWIRSINSLVPPPDLTVFLDAPVTHCIWRIQQQRGLTFQKYERADQLEKVRGNYLQAIRMLRSEGERIAVLDGTLRIEEIRRAIKKLVGNLLIEQDINNLIRHLDPKLEVVREVKTDSQLQVIIKDVDRAERVTINVYPSTGKIVAQGRRGQLYESVMTILNTIRPGPGLDEQGDMTGKLL